MHADPETQRRPGRTVPRMRPHADPEPTPAPPCTRPPDGWACTRTEGHLGPCPTVPATYRTPPTVTAVVTVRVRPRLGQEFGDVHTARATAHTWLAALTAAHDAAASLVAPGSPFHVSSTRRY
jgi:hypothetical protein